MLVLHCRIVVKLGTCGSSPASSHTSRARLLYPRFGTTEPHTQKSTGPEAWWAIAWTTGTESPIASRPAKGPSTRRNGVRNPAAIQISALPSPFTTIPRSWRGPLGSFAPTSLYPMLPPPGARRDAPDLLESAREVALIGESRRQ